MDQDLYDKAARMVLGSKTREELQTTWNFISLIEKGFSHNPEEDISSRESIESLRKMWFEKDSEIFS